MDIQKTIVLTYGNEKIVSKPFTFGIAVLIDDEQKRYFRKASNEGLERDEIIESLPDNAIYLKALKKMFEGTIITDDVIENEIDYTELRKAIKRIQNMYYQIDDEIKNS